MNRLSLFSVSLVLLTNLIYSQSVDVKDGDSNSLITINDEGNAGSITIPDATTVGTPTNKLYNEGSTLYWDGNTLNTGTGDNLGNHTATQDIDMSGFEVNLNGGYLSGDGSDEGVYIHAAGGIVDFNYAFDDFWTVKYI